MLSPAEAQPVYAQPGPPAPPRRIAYLDWLRVVAVVGVVYFHSARVFDYVDWNVKNPDTSLFAMVFVAFFTQWGMPLLCVLAGASSWFALRRRTGAQFVRERVSRLVIPLVIGFLLLSPPQAYVEALSHGRFVDSFFAYYPYFFTHLQFGWHLWWVGADLYHLWFLAFLFLFSVLALPLFAGLRSRSGQRLLETLAVVCARPGGFLVLALPLALIQMTLRAGFAGYTDWADFCYLFACYVFGYLLFAHPRLESLIRRQGGIALGVGVACFLGIVWTYVAGYLVPWETAPSYSVGYLFYQLLRSVDTCAWLVCLLAFGGRFLNFSNRFLHYASETVLPFYLLQQPLIILIAFYVVQWPSGIGLKYVVISTGALVASLALYELGIRRWKPTRWAFGLKSRQQSRIPGESPWARHLRHPDSQPLAHALFKSRTRSI